MPGADIDSGHVPLCGQIKVRLKRWKNNNKNIRRNKEILRDDTEIQETYRVIVKDRYS